jgi:hypothetical protein
MRDKELLVAVESGDYLRGSAAKIHGGYPPFAFDPAESLSALLCRRRTPSFQPADKLRGATSRLPPGKSHVPGVAKEVAERVKLVGSLGGPLPVRLPVIR